MPKTAAMAKSGKMPGRWVLQDAKARFSEVVRKARSEGPQHVSVHGREEVVVITVQEYRALQGHAAVRR